MSDQLNGKTIAFLATDGVEQIELTRPWQAIRDAGGKPVLLSPKKEEIQGYNHLDKADTFDVDKPVAEANASDYDGLVLPGGVANPDDLRIREDAVGFVKDFIASGRPVAAICHGAWTLVEADAVKSRKLTSWPSLETDIRNAGGEWVDEEVVVDGQLVTSRNPGDLDAFCRAAIERFAA